MARATAAAVAAAAAAASTAAVATVFAASFLVLVPCLPPLFFLCFTALALAALAVSEVNLVGENTPLIKAPRLCQPLNLLNAKVLRVMLLSNKRALQSVELEEVALPSGTFQRI